MEEVEDGGGGERRADKTDFLKIKNKKFRNQLGTDIWRERREKQNMIILISLAGYQSLRTNTIWDLINL